MLVGASEPHSWLLFKRAACTFVDLLPSFGAMESNMDAHMKTMARPKRTGENGPALPEIFTAHDTTFVAGGSPESQENIGKNAKRSLRLMICNR